VFALFFFLCHLCLFLFFPWFLGSLSVFSILLCSMCVSSSLIFVFLFLCVRSLVLWFFLLAVFSPVLCPPVRSLFFVLFRSPILWFSPCSSPLFLGISSVCVFPQRFLICPLGSIPHPLWLFSGLYKAIECHALVRQMKRTHKTVTLMMETHRGARGGFSSSSLVCLRR